MQVSQFRGKLLLVESPKINCSNMKKIYYLIRLVFSSTAFFLEQKKQKVLSVLTYLNIQNEFPQ